MSPAGSPFICDWDASQRSMDALDGLGARIAVVGHGEPLGEDTARKLAASAREFPVPKQGRYVRTPARTDENGIVFLPPAPPDPLPRVLLGAGVLAILGLLASRRGGAWR